MISQPKTFEPEEVFEEVKTVGVVDLLPMPLRKEEKDSISISIDDLKSWLVCGILPKTTYVYLMLLIKFDGDTNVDIKALSSCLSCAVAIDDEKTKIINFSEEETLSEIAKLNKKGALSIKQTAIQLHLNL